MPDTPQQGLVKDFMSVRLGDLREPLQRHVDATYGAGAPINVSELIRSLIKLGLESATKPSSKPSRSKSNEHKEKKRRAPAAPTAKGRSAKRTADQAGA